MERGIISALAAAVAMVVVAACGGANDGSAAAPAAAQQGGDATSAVTTDTGITPSSDPASPTDSTTEIREELAAASIGSTAAGPSLTVRARGTAAGGVGPIMQVLVGGVRVGSVEVKSTTYSNFAFPLSASVAPGARVDVVFTNDGSVNGSDRNLYVDSLTVNSTALRPTDAGVMLDLGAGTAAFDGVNVVAGRSDILWNAALRFKAPGLTVRARASTAGGVGPTMQVLVDGVLQGSAEVKASAYADYGFALKTTPSQRVDIVFANDGASGSEDRNLYIEAVNFAGRNLHPADSGALIDIGSGAAALDGLNVIPGQSAILWNAALRLPVSASAAAAGNALLAAASGASTPSTPSSTSTAGAIDIRTTGARCDGSFDNSAAIASAIASAKAKRVAVYVPAGVCAYGDVIRLDGVKLVGAGDASVLYALNPLREAIFLFGSGVEVSLLKLSGRKATTRQAAWEATRIALFGATNFVIDKVTIDGSAAGGIQTARSTSNGRITNNTIKDTLADSIHMTDKASYITLENNQIERAGDDGIAVVSYRSDGGLVNHITARNNVILNNKWGRQMSVVGGSQVLYENNRLESNLAGAACVYLAQESSYGTYGAHDVVARYNTLKTCGGPSTGHGAVMVYSSGQEANTNITLIRNDIVQNGPPGIRVFSALNTGVRVDSNRVQGASPALDITSPGVTVIPYTSGTVGYVAP
jgi:parallel beta-helix repeat protein